jgi:hypothetical protein
MIIGASQFMACVFSTLAALFWIKTASVKLPSPMNEQWGGGGPFSTAVATQTRWNARAAWCAAGAAAFQALAYVVP